MGLIKVIEDDENLSYQPEPEKPEFNKQTNKRTGKQGTEVEPESEPETGKPKINHQKSSSKITKTNNVESSSTRLIPGIFGVVLLFFLVN